MFCKADALKDLAVFTAKHLYWRFFLINFIKKSLQHRCFTVNMTKCLSTAPAHYTFQKFYVMIKFFGCLRVQNWYFHISCATALFSFITLVLESEIHCYFVYILFYTKRFIKCNFCMDYNDDSFTILIESLKFRNNSRSIATYSGNLLWKMWAVLQAMAKNNPTKKQIETKVIKWH